MYAEGRARVGFGRKREDGKKIAEPLARFMVVLRRCARSRSDRVGVWVDLSVICARDPIKRVPVARRYMHSPVETQ